MHKDEEIRLALLQAIVSKRSKPIDTLEDIAEVERAFLKLYPLVVYNAEVTKAMSEGAKPFIGTPAYANKLDYTKLIKLPIRATAIDNKSFKQAMQSLALGGRVAHQSWYLQVWAMRGKECGMLAPEDIPHIPYAKQPKDIRWRYISLPAIMLPQFEDEYARVLANPRDKRAYITVKHYDVCFPGPEADKLMWVSTTIELRPNTLNKTQWFSF